MYGSEWEGVKATSLSTPNLTETRFLRVSFSLSGFLGWRSVFVRGDRCIYLGSKNQVL
ncbi:hypothetical protein AmaxDRAFT_1077 [Limnospira maxima CS-328]|uniref:Uncharacterized protein n=1 Tax=Limnospira maxima CS-328 TaxID=513049 RepID=B5VX35_LIMMA|nr:hypothetical protein AmaxDRAFT_1077 [Limnospira maxima CS-328]